jgi:hypothetical protein
LQQPLLGLVELPLGIKHAGKVGQALPIQSFGQLGRFFIGFDGLLQGLATVLLRDEGRPAGPVRILDLGSGDCQIPLAVTQWAAKHGRQAEFTCLDHNAQVLDAAREALARAGCRTIQLEQADIFTYRPTREFDYAVGSMIFHHFTDEQIDSLIARLRSFVRRALLINDLRRCALSYAVCRFLTAGVDARLRHDALLSILRGFRPTELTASLSRHDPAAVARGAWFCRVAGVVRFNRGEGA